MPKILTLGEILLRLSTCSGDLLSCSQSLNVNYGGSEANVASTLAHFGHDVSFASMVPNSPLGTAAVRNLRANGIDTSHLLFGGKRLGIYFLEQGSTLRNSKVIYDREHSSFCQMDIHEWDFDRLFENVSLFHISGITFALSESWKKNGQILVKAAYDRGIPVSFDINFRQAMWTLEEAKEAIIPILPMVSYCCANYMDARNFFEIDASVAVPGNMEECYRKISQIYPNIRALYATDRYVISPSCNELQGMLWIKGEFKKSERYHLFPIVDRIGGGDAYVAGILHGILTGMEAEQTVQFATAASVLKHSINGDMLPLTERDVKSWLDTPGREVVR
ncbi:sugar kinase [Weizmannia acidilactici]|uniref:sugar kinase n=1 Tax=Weizmannia acidilactici TaxID=2607726 RepID=UPI00124C493D|nr:sugar kinase [Weizmannia acidilactici]GER65920.1 2-dehydro-3-deoxygluconokinase [Weizmannia acidilactici]GER74376.1 2-dehydro-3-deoxygluconokinase [Weizmannia acidilactici]